MQIKDLFCFSRMALLSLFLSVTPAMAETAQVALQGKYLIHENASCAGWKFTKHNEVIRFDELICQPSFEPSYTARVEWLNNKQFAIIESNNNVQHDKAPVVTLYEFIKRTGSTVWLREIWTGWGKAHHSIEKFKLSE